MDHLRNIENILTLGSKDTTYKFAVLRAIIDYVIEYPIERDEYRISLSWIACKWLTYYWPLYHHRIPQGPIRSGKRETVIEGLIEHFIKSVEEAKQPLGKLYPATMNTPQGWSKIRTGLIHEQIPFTNQTKTLIISSRRVILQQPLRYIPNIQGKQLHVFQLHCHNSSEYESARIASLNRLITRKLHSAQTLQEMITNDPTSLIIPKDVISDIRPLRFWILEAILAKWARFSETLRKNRGEAVSSTLFQLANTEAMRDPSIMAHYRGLYEEILLKTCTWCNARLRGTWDVDHVFPWSRYPVNAFWNLVPTCKKCNRGSGGKFDLLLEWSPCVESRLVEVFQQCLAVTNPIIQRDLVRIPIQTKTPQDIVNYLQKLFFDLDRSVILKTWQPPICGDGS